MGQRDCVVIGAGPAGAWTAYHLARRGARVLIADASHPREKPCGGGVTGRALALVAEAVPVQQLPAVAIRTARFIDTRAGISVRVPLQKHRGGTRLVVACRRDFDSQLLTAATKVGAELIAARVVGVTREGGCFRIHTSHGRAYEARYVVGADGANSLIRRRLARPFGRAQLSMATGFFAAGVTSDEIVIELVADPPGYIWSFPRPDHLAIGICAPADTGVTAASLRARTAEWIAVTRLAPGARLQPYSWPIPSLSADDFQKLELAGSNWLLAGDAAGLVDPITREGIFFALRSAALAAEALASGSSRPDRDYSERVRAEVVSELTRASRFKERFFRPRVAGLMIDALGRSDRIQRVLADLIAGAQGYRGLKWRLAKTLEIGLAWKALRASR